MKGVTEYTCRDFYLNISGTHSHSALAKEVRMREARLEKYIKDYVYDKTGESVYLHLEDAIRISHITKRGSITLAILWANILQHPGNFPPDQHPYQKFFDAPTGGDRLILKAEKIRFTIFMSSGSLVMEGPYIYDWFTRRFKSLLDCYDESFDKTWKFIPTPLLPVSDETPKHKMNDTNTDIEDYLLLRTRQHAVCTALDKRMEEQAGDYISGLGNLSLDQPLFEGADLDKQTECLRSGGVRDGLTHVYKLWRSLLHKWLGCRGTKVYIANPEIDAERLKDIVDISVVNQFQGQLEVIYTNSTCDPHKGHQAEHVKKLALDKLEAKHRTFAEYKVLHRVMIPLKKINSRFIAGVREDGKAEVLVTSAGFHGNSFIHECLETVLFLEMEEAVFLEQYVDAMSSPVVASIY